MERSRRWDLLLLAGLLATAPSPAHGRAQPPDYRVPQVPAAEPPPPGGAVPAMPAVPREAVDPPTPVVSIRVRVPSSAAPGRELEYRMVVENGSPADAHHVRVRVPVPANTRYKAARPAPTSTGTAGGEIAWDLGTLKGLQRREISLVVEPTGGEDVICCARVSFEHGQCVRTRVAKPALRVRTTGPERARPNDTLTYTLELTNAGSADATDVVLTEELPPGLEFLDSNPSTSGANPLTWKVGTLAPGDRRTFEFKVFAKQSGSHPLKATVAAAGVKAAEGNLSRVLVGEATLTFAKTGPAWRSLDRTATYYLTVSNPGSVPAVNVQLSDELYYNAELRSGIEFVGASDDGRLAGNDVRWSLGTLAPGSRRTVSLTLRALRGGTFKNVAAVRADGGQAATASTTTEFETPAGLTLDVEKPVDPVAAGKTATFTFRLRQHGATPSANVGLSVTLPEEMQYVDASGKSAGKQEGRTVTFLPLGELAPGAEATYAVTVRAERPGAVKLRATATADPAPKGGKIERTESVSIVPESASPSPPVAPDGDKK
jgi:uncharacterized repeat protein (TIGR01451 family)